MRTLVTILKFDDGCEIKLIPIPNENSSGYYGITVSSDGMLNTEWFQTIEEAKAFVLGVKVMATLSGGRINTYMEDV